MRLVDITKNLSKMNEEELREHVRHIRHTKYIAKPAKEKRIKDNVKIKTRQNISKVDKLMEGMSTEDKQQLLLLLEGDKNV